MICDNCKEPACAFYGRGRRTENGTILVAKEKLCYDCFCDKYGLEKSA